MDDAATLAVSSFGKPLPVLAALRRGYFAGQGLEVRYEQTSGSIQQISELLEGRWDLAHTAVDNVIAHVDERDVDLVVVLVLETGIPQKLMLQPGLNSYEDLRGQTLGVDAPTTGYAFVLREMLARNGLPAGEYETVSIGGTAERAIAVTDGRIAATLLAPPHDQTAIRAGCRVIDRAADYFPKYPSLTVATTRRRTAEDSAAVVAYCSALLAAQRWVRAPENVDQVIAMLATERRIGLEAAREQLAAEWGYPFHGMSGLTDIYEAIEVVRALRHRMTGGTSGRGCAADYFDERYMRDAMSRLAND